METPVIGGIGIDQGEGLLWLDRMLPGVEPGQHLPAVKSERLGWMADQLQIMAGHSGGPAMALYGRDVGSAMEEGFTGHDATAAEQVQPAGPGHLPLQEIKYRLPHPRRCGAGDGARWTP